MNLYIQVENDQPKNHPAFEENLIQAFGRVPNNWEPFLRVERPSLKLYETFESEEPTYQKVNGVWTDVWTIRDMTDEEKDIADQERVVSSFFSRWQAENWASWVYDKTTKTMQPPIPRPELDEIKHSQHIFTFWCGADNNWKDTPVKPEGNYKFNFFAWEWVEVTG